MRLKFIPIQRLAFGGSVRTQVVVMNGKPLLVNEWGWGRVAQNVRKTFNPLEKFRLRLFIHGIGRRMSKVRFRFILEVANSLIGVVSFVKCVGKKVLNHFYNEGQDVGVVRMERNYLKPLVIANEEVNNCRNV